MWDGDEAETPSIDRLRTFSFSNTYGDEERNMFPAWFQDFLTPFPLVRRLRCASSLKKGGGKRQEEKMWISSAAFSSVFRLPFQPFVSQYPLGCISKENKRICLTTQRCWRYKFATLHSQEEHPVSIRSFHITRPSTQISCRVSCLLILSLISVIFSASCFL